MSVARSSPNADAPPPEANVKKLAASEPLPKAVVVVPIATPLFPFEKAPPPILKDGPGFVTPPPFGRTTPPPPSCVIENFLAPPEFKSNNLVLTAGV